MMSGDPLFAVDTNRVVHETVDGEVILIQLERGNYYSLTGSGPEIWELLLQGRTAAEIARSLAARHRVGASLARGAVDRLVQELESENLIEIVDGSHGREQRVEDDADVPGSSGSRFVAPILEKYTDMQDYLLIDPIHEVDDPGWPNLKRP